MNTDDDFLASYVTDRPPSTLEVRPTAQSENTISPTTTVPTSDAPSSETLEVQSESNEVVQFTAVQRDNNLPSINCLQHQLEHQLAIHQVIISILWRHQKK